jgi:hypothetical protein
MNEKDFCIEIRTSHNKVKMRKMMRKRVHGADAERIWG